MPTTHITPAALSPEQAAAYLGGISTKTLANWRCAGGGPRFVRLGNRVVYRIADLDAHLERNASKHSRAR